MNPVLATTALVLSFLILVLASRQIGGLFARLHLPLISGFLFTGILVGPYVLGLLPVETGERLRFVDEISLAVIAFAAGSELYLKELRSRMGSIAWVTLGNVLAIPILCALALFWLSGALPFLQGMPVGARIVVSLLAGTILIARSPSSAIAIIGELRAKGPFTQMVLGVTMITDVLVIALFAINSSAVDAVLTGLPFSVRFLLVLGLEFALEILIGYALGRAIQALLARHTHHMIKSVVLLVMGYAVFVLTGFVRELSAHYLPFELLFEPLLICLIASFVVANYTPYRMEFMKILEEVSPPIYVIFFTLTGASLALDVLVETWPIALALFGVRLLGIFIGSFAGGVVARDPMVHNRLSWMTFITQAGVGLGLAKEVAVEYPEWGGAFATLVISVIVVSQLVGPPLFKWAINHVGEAHTRGHGIAEDDEELFVIIFGLEGQSLALARLLRTHGWHTVIASRQAAALHDLGSSDVEIRPIPSLTKEALDDLEANRADAIVALLSNAENKLVCELVYEHYGTERIIARMPQREDFARLRQIGVHIVEPATAMVGLLEQFVRTPTAASLLLGTEAHQSIVDIHMRNTALDGVALRDLRLPLDVLILSVRRGGGMLVSHGYTQLKFNDWVTVVGPPESVEIVMLQFEGIVTPIGTTP